MSELWTYPVKSCRGTALDRADVEPWGLAGDRRWMLVDPDGAVVTAREVPRLLLVHPTTTATGLRLTAPDLEPLEVTTPAQGSVPVTIWRSRLDAVPAGPAADAWLSAAAGRAVRLVWMEDPTSRPTSPDFGEDGDRVSLADGYPLLLTTESSLTALEDAVTETRQELGEPLGMRRFRPNLVVAGSPAWAEDDWRRIRVGGPGGVVFRLVKGCARCVMTTLDPDTAEGGREPVKTMARVRRFDGATWFGVNLVPDGRPGAVVRVGDDVEVLDAVAPGAGPVRR